MDFVRKRTILQCLCWPCPAGRYKRGHTHGLPWRKLLAPPPGCGSLGARRICSHCSRSSPLLHRCGFQDSAPQHSLLCPGRVERARELRPTFSQSEPPNRCTRLPEVIRLPWQPRTLTPATWRPQLRIESFHQQTNTASNETPETSKKLVFFVSFQRELALQL